MRRLFIGLQDLSYLYIALITCAIMCWENLGLQGSWLLQTIQCQARLCMYHIMLEYYCAQVFKNKNNRLRKYGELHHYASCGLYGVSKMANALKIKKGQ